MKKLFKFLLFLISLCILVFGGILVYLSAFLPNIDAPHDLKVNMTEENIKKGRYLANEVMGCVGCHAQRDFSRFAVPIVEESKGAGGELWDQRVNFPGTMYAPNISQTALRDWSDGELYRAITAGVDKDGNALFPIMPYLQYGKLPKEDIYAVIAHLRTLPPKEESYPERELDFPLNFIVNLMPASGSHHLAPNEFDLENMGSILLHQQFAMIVIYR